MKETIIRLKEWQDSLRTRLKKLEDKEACDFSLTIPQQNHRFAQMKNLVQKITDLETAMQALKDNK